MSDGVGRGIGCHSDPIFLEIELMGGERCRTQTLVVDPGDALELEIWPELASMPECS